MSTELWPAPGRWTPASALRLVEARASRPDHRDADDPEVERLLRRAVIEAARTGSTQARRASHLFTLWRGPREACQRLLAHLHQPEVEDCDFEEGDDPDLTGAPSDVLELAALAELRWPLGHDGRRHQIAGLLTDDPTFGPDHPLTRRCWGRREPQGPAAHLSGDDVLAEFGEHHTWRGPADEPPAEFIDLIARVLLKLGAPSGFFGPQLWMEWETNDGAVVMGAHRSGDSGEVEHRIALRKLGRLDVEQYQDNIHLAANRPDAGEEYYRWYYTVPESPPATTLTETLPGDRAHDWVSERELVHAFVDDHPASMGWLPPRWRRDLGLSWQGREHRAFLHVTADHAILLQDGEPVDHATSCSPPDVRELVDRTFDRVQSWGGFDDFVRSATIVEAPFSAVSNNRTGEPPSDDLDELQPHWFVDDDGNSVTDPIELPQTEPTPDAVSGDHRPFARVPDWRNAGSVLISRNLAHGPHHRFTLEAGLDALRAELFTCFPSRAPHRDLLAVSEAASQALGRQHDFAAFVRLLTHLAAGDARHADQVVASATTRWGADDPRTEELIVWRALRHHRDLDDPHSAKLWAEAARIAQASPHFGPDHLVTQVLTHDVAALERASLGAEGRGWLALARKATGAQQPTSRSDR